MSLEINGHMLEFSTLSDIFGRSAWPAIKNMNEVEVTDVDADNMSCTIFINGWEYRVRRESNRKWYLLATGYYRTFVSQQKLLDWIVSQT